MFLFIKNELNNIHFFNDFLSGIQSLWLHSHIYLQAALKGLYLKQNLFPNTFLSLSNFKLVCIKQYKYRLYREEAILLQVKGFNL